MRKEDLIEEIKSVFKSEQYPGDDNIVYDNSYKHKECSEIKDLFKGKIWSSLSTEFLTRAKSNLSFLSSQGFRYYLPAFLIYNIQYFEESEYLGEELVKVLTLPQEVDSDLIIERIIKMYSSQQTRSADFEITLDEQLRLANRKVNIFIDRMSGFSAEQGLAIKHYLEYIYNEYREELTDTDPQIAIERYWFQFK